MRLTVAQLGFDLLQHVVGHHGAQGLDVRTIPSVLQRGEVGFAGTQETFGVKVSRNAPRLIACQTRTNHGSSG